MKHASQENIPLQFTDYLVIGSGIAGLRAAITLSEHAQVLIVNKGTSPESSSEYAQGGIAVALESADSVEAHSSDTLEAGRGLCNPEAVEVLVKEGPGRVQELIHWGARFDQYQDRFLLAREAGHRSARILRAQGDATGTEIMRALLKRVKSLPSVRPLDRHFTVDLLIDEGRCIGAILLSDTGQVLAVGAKAVILASGGAGQVYERTTNPPVATGDGMAMAFRAGAVLEDMEFVQFHPTALALPNAPELLLTEAMRGEGAVLRNHRKEAFMERYDPAGDLAPRDVVSRGVWQEMQTGGTSHVYLDATHLKPDFIRQRFPTITRICLKHGLDITQTPIPVAPSAHFMIGGLKTDLCGATSISGLYAAGEVCCSGIHGANRLASNSLLEGLVFGARVGQAVSDLPHRHSIDSAQLRAALRHHFPTPQQRQDIPMSSNNPRTHLRKMMWNHAGIIRNRESLKEAVKPLQDWAKPSTGLIRSQQEGEMRNLAMVALLIVRGAALRNNSIGVHYRSDDPDPGGKQPSFHIAFRHPDHPEGYFQ